MLIFVVFTNFNVLLYFINFRTQYSSTNFIYFFTELIDWATYFNASYRLYGNDNYRQQWIKKIDRVMDKWCFPLSLILLWCRSERIIPATPGLRDWRRYTGVSAKRGVRGRVMIKSKSVNEGVTVWKWE